MTAQPSAIDSGTAGELEQITLTPPDGGWCRGAYLVTVFLQRGPIAQRRWKAEQPIPCPLFATQELDTGSTSFTVGSSAPLVSVPNLRGLKPATADRLLRRRHTQGALRRSQQLVRRHSAPRANHLAETSRGREGAAWLKGASPDQLRQLIAIREGLAGSPEAGGHSYRGSNALRLVSAKDCESIGDASAAHNPSVAG